MKNIKSVNVKSKAKATPVWGKFSFYFKTTEACNKMAMPIAALMRKNAPRVYYARYTSASENRLDVYVQAPQLSAFDVLNFDTCKPGACRWTRIEGPIPCPGSEAHAAGFDAVIRMSHAFKTMTPAEQQEQFIDVLHWMHNMMGYDYVDEARCHLTSINCILGVFERSIRLGNQMSKAAKKAGRMKGAERN